MQKTLLSGKIHRAKVTEADLNYIGSITIDYKLMQAANIVPYELVHVVDITNGNRLQTYAISGEPDSGIIAINGAAAHLIKPNDLIIIMAYVNINLEKSSVIHNWKPNVVYVDNFNKIINVSRMIEQHTEPLN